MFTFDQPFSFSRHFNTAKLKYSTCYIYDVPYCNVQSRVFAGLDQAYISLNVLCNECIERHIQCFFVALEHSHQSLFAFFIQLSSHYRHDISYVYNRYVIESICVEILATTPDKITVEAISFKKVPKVIHV